MFANFTFWMKMKNKTYKYKGYIAEPYKIIGMSDINWKVDVFGLGYYFASLSEFKKWVNKNNML